MLKQLEQSKSQWGGQNNAIDSWLQERQAVLVAYCELIGIQPSDCNEKSLPNEQHIKRFCQLLMDYISAGHFEIFNNIVEKCNEKGPNDKIRAQEIFPKLNLSTDLALQFNDKYAELSHEKLPDNFDIQLSTLGRELEARFTYEDQLLAILHRY